MNRIKLLLLAVLTTSILSSCEKEKLEVENGDYYNGIIVVNEGQFMHGNASVSFLPADLSKIENGIYHSVNQLDLGDQAQSVELAGDNAYFVVTGSNKIEVANKETMEKVVTIATGLTNPRYCQAVDNNIAYVSCWGDTNDNNDDYIAIVNTQDNTYESQIQVPLGPEKLVANDDYLFIAHKGAWGTNNKVSVLDLNTRQITHTINVGDRPNSMVVKDHYLWVLCGGEPSYASTETAGQLFKIDIDNNFNIVQTIDFATTQHPDFLTSDDDKLYYYVDGKFYEFTESITSLPTTEIISYPTAYNAKAKNGKLYVTDANGYQQEGLIVVFDLSTKAEISRKTAGLIPGDVAFNLE